MRLRTPLSGARLQLLFDLHRVPTSHGPAGSADVVAIEVSIDIHPGVTGRDKQDPHPTRPGARPRRSRPTAAIAIAGRRRLRRRIRVSRARVWQVRAPSIGRIPALLVKTSSSSKYLRRTERLAPGAARRASTPPVALLGRKRVVHPNASSKLSADVGGLSDIGAAMLSAVALPAATAGGSYASAPVRRCR